VFSLNFPLHNAAESHDYPLHYAIDSQIAQLLYAAGSQSQQQIVKFVKLQRLPLSLKKQSGKKKKKNK
jgi:hypothetical protein